MPETLEGPQRCPPAHYTYLSKARLFSQRILAVTAALAFCDRCWLVCSLRYCYRRYMTNYCFTSTTTTTTAKSGACEVS